MTRTVSATTWIRASVWSTIAECNGSGVPAGFCDCSGNTEDVIGVCGGNCVLDADGDGICDLDDGNERYVRR